MAVTFAVPLYETVVLSAESETFRAEAATLIVTWSVVTTLPAASFISQRIYAVDVRFDTE